MKRWSYRSKASSSSSYTNLQSLYGSEDNGKGGGGGRMKRLSIRSDNAFYDSISLYRPLSFSHSSKIPHPPAAAPAPIVVRTFAYFNNIF